MIKNEIKQILQKQHIPFTVAVAQKVEDLKSGKITEDYLTNPINDDTLQNAFMEDLSVVEETNATITSPSFNLSVADKIAVLRGISLPGNYLSQKKP